MSVLNSKVVRVNQYHGVEVNEYQGDVFLISVRRGAQEVNYRDYCYPEIYDSQQKKRRFIAEPEKPRPIQFKLGNRKEAVEVLEKIILKIRGDG